MIHAVNAADKLRPDNGTDEDLARHYEQYVKPLEEKIIEAFPKKKTTRQIFDIVLREEHWEQTISGWQKSGAAVFSFAPPLVSLLNKTSVMDIPIQSLRIPYHSLYVSLPGGFLPDFNEEFEIDGMYLTSEKFLPQRLKESFTTEAAIRTEAENDIRQFGAEGMKRLYEIYEVASFDDYVGRRLADNATARDSYERFCEDPDEWYATTGTQQWSPYWLLLIDFTFRSKTRRTGPWRNEYIAREPILRAGYSFPNHRSTVRDAVADTEADGLPMETFFEDVDHPNDLRNVISSPEHLEEVTRLVFNVVCYLNWPERDESKRMNDARVQARIDKSASNTKRKKSETDALKDGFRLIHFCGYRGNGHLASADLSGVTVAAHWRRGHWRNQRFGKRLSDTKLVWIAPTLVNESKDTGEIVTTLYETNGRTTT